MWLVAQFYYRVDWFSNSSNNLYNCKILHNNLILEIEPLMMNDHAFWQNYLNEPWENELKNSIMENFKWKQQNKPAVGAV